ncbi:Arylsulfatase [Stratiformator vulcanicus]|uniref:Arylsulfatase n=2 Tax=Stratiformator vulcanicus TaxID=2527980 RepID=A0A517QYJ7_9PLAN|nr:Arylsulfatase [Stratiformator vulcanicus]
MQARTTSRRGISCFGHCSSAASTTLTALPCVLMAVLISLTITGRATGSERPNILLIFTDDQGWPTLGSYGNEHVPTPHLDRLAAEGIQFTDAYVQPQCTPSRASLLTGQHSARNGMWHVLTWYGYPHARMTEPMFVEDLPRDSWTLAKGLKAAGYRTACLGKWHLNSNDDGNYKRLNPNAAKHFGFDYVNKKLPQRVWNDGGDRGVEWLTDEAIKFIGDQRDEPWFVYLSHHMIHGKVVAPNRLTQKYLDRGYPAEGMFNATYLAGLETIDQSVGRIRSALRELGEDENTLIIFLSDNGGVDERFHVVGVPGDEQNPARLELNLTEFDNAPLRMGKGSMYEGGIRVPMIVHWQDYGLSGEVVKTPVHVVDIVPTLFEAAGADTPASHVVDGDSLLPLITGEGSFNSDRPLFWHLPLYDARWGLTPCAVVRQGPYKLIHFFGDRFDADLRYRIGQHDELYHLVTDPGEQQNLMATEPETGEKLKATLAEWLNKIDAPIPVQNPHYDPAKAFAETREMPRWYLEERSVK